MATLQFIWILFISLKFYSEFIIVTDENTLYNTLIALITIFYYLRYNKNTLKIAIRRGLFVVNSKLSFKAQTRFFFFFLTQKQNDGNSDIM